MKSLIPFAAIIVLQINALAIGAPGDWPMWRYDAGRTATSPHGLPDELELRWSRKYPQRVQTWDDPLNNDLMAYDRVFEPIVMGQRLIVGFNDSDKIVCWDLASGSELWRFYANGPVRMPPAGHGDDVFVTSDDGYLYCIDVSRGDLRWKFRGGPGDRKVLGNRRIVSMWPARGGPVVHDGHVYFASSIWPFMGTFIYDLDAETGDVVWVNDRTSASYIKQPHSAPSFAGIAPQGAMVATKDALIVPGGRSVPAVFDRQTGELSHFLLNAGGKGNGGTFVMADDPHYYVHTRLRGVRRFDLKTGNKTALMLNEPVLDGNYLITSDDKTVKSISSNADGTEQSTIWELPVDGSGDLIRAGQRIYAAGAKSITVIEIAEDSKSATVVGRIDSPNTARLVAGGDSLIAVSLDGRIACFRQPTESESVVDWAEVRNDGGLASRGEVGDFLTAHAATDGIAFVFGVQDHHLLDEMLSASELQIVALAEDLQVVEELRRRYDEMGIYGSRISLQRGTPAEFQGPAWMASVVAVAGENAAYLQPESLDAMYKSVRPYGGLLWFPDVSNKSAVAVSVEQANLENAQLLADEAGVAAKRIGPLQGAAPWTHLYGDVANTVKSDDQLVKAPLGLLWFGGNTHEDVLPRHSHAPGEQVLGGRLFVEGMNSITARDVYTGRVLWRREYDSLGTEGIYYDATYADTPLSTQYNQVHIPGANARGTNFVVTEAGVYLVIADRCEVLDPATGETVRTIVLPEAVNPKGAATWTYIGVYGDYLIAGVDFANADDASALLKLIEKLSKRGAAWSPKWFASRRLAVLDATSGELLWHTDARNSFLHNGIVAGDGKLYLLDKLPQSIEEQQSRRGRTKPSDYRIAAFDVQTGEPIWQTHKDVFGTWLGYSEEHDLLVHAGAAAPDRAMDEVNAGVVAIKGGSGEAVWKNLGLEYSGPCIIHHDKIIMNSRSYATTSGVVSIHDGKPVLIENPVTGETGPWSYKRAYGCNTAVASEHLLTFRSGAAGYYDLNMQCGVANLGGFRSGCSSNLIAADGVLNAPDFTRTCSCGYQNQTSLALIHMPDVDVWTMNPFEKPETLGSLTRLGVNFGAAGTRRADDGTVWVEYPPAAEVEFPLELKLDGNNVKFTRRHSSTQTGELPWVHASAVKGVLAVELTVSEPDSPQRFTVRLHFADPVSEDRYLVQGDGPKENLSEGQQNVGRQVATYEGVLSLDGKIRIELQSVDDGMPPALTGIEIIADRQSNEAVN